MRWSSIALSLASACALLATRAHADEPTGAVTLEGGALVSPARGPRRDLAPLVSLTAVLFLVTTRDLAVGAGLSLFPYPRLFQVGVPVHLELRVAGTLDDGALVRLGGRGVFVPIGVCTLGGSAPCPEAAAASEGARTAGWGFAALAEAGLIGRFPLRSESFAVRAAELHASVLAGPMATLSGPAERPLGGIYLGAILGVGGTL